MTEQQPDHVPVEDLAAYAAGELDAVAAVPVEAHVLLCAACRADVEGLRATAAALAAVPPATMPADVAARLDAALAAERATGADAPAVAPPEGGTVLPMRRRPARWASLSAAAAAVSLLVAVGVGLVAGSDEKNGPTARLADAPTRDTRTFASGHNYSRANLAATVTGLLAGRRPPALEAAGPEPAPMAGSPGSRNSRSAQTTSDSVAKWTGGTWAGGAVGLRSKSGLDACLAALRAGGPSVEPLVLDYALFDRRPALVVVLPTVVDGRAVTDRVDVWVVAPECGRDDAKVLDFHRLDVG